MPRSSSSSSGKGRSTPFSYKAAVFQTPRTPVPLARPVAAPPAPTHMTHSVQQPGFFSNMWQGFGLGAGQSIAFNMFRSPTEVKHVHESAPAAPVAAPAATRERITFSKEYTQCMEEAKQDEEACKHLLTE